MSKRFTYRPDGPFGPDVIDHQTGRWMSIDLASDFAAVVNDAVSPEGWVLVPKDPATPLPDYDDCARQATEATGLPSQHPSPWLSIFIREISRWCEHRALDDKMSARALQLADVHMFELLQAHCRAVDPHRCVLALLDDSGRTVVRTLGEADPVIVQAFEWLSERQYVSLAKDGEGEYIEVRRRPGED